MRIFDSKRQLQTHGCEAFLSLTFTVLNAEALALGTSLQELDDRTGNRPAARIAVRGPDTTPIAKAAVSHRPGASLGSGLGALLTGQGRQRVPSQACHSPVARKPHQVCADKDPGQE